MHPPQLGLRHVALWSVHFEKCLHFYRDIIGMSVEWQPDADNVYLTSQQQDNLALHRSQHPREKHQALDHLGFVVAHIDAVNQWHDYLSQHLDANKLSPVKHHRDGACSFYCQDPDGNSIQIIYHPPIAQRHRT